MKNTLILFLLCSIFSCKSESSKDLNSPNTEAEASIPFNSEKWKVAEKGAFPFRNAMLHEILYTDTIRLLYKDEILNLLGEPSYYMVDKSFLYYTISKSTMGPMTLSSKTMVIKLSEDYSVDWIKLHE